MLPTWRLGLYKLLERNIKIAKERIDQAIKTRKYFGERSIQGNIL
ncbi:hypothetical protein LEP1GSC132_0634 [Leptospira kirschneri str. 200803703]|nr:hypothetical protein LEP1GSC044_0657 [Leptospira kirschneri serovar Grippotyphosa str. RM52]EKP03213.1 hypothetical protein LEP1GSC018_0917 [Leptospira kirschneri str. 2008720114]EKQ85710.1 hypothetical protein LEP1GSC064_0785 [Leptospira kirschneri serovar Grippotyphosa str. Moskva]EKR09406.1 hypothetical protein LEP1GSC122_0052 [Leptospira kirschneri serovar Valbuzzi str. 200702274]EMK03096.1 hypothetical protein LEP1GSC176_0694 [Leptospira kirschneri str. MMD1493]EMK16461.1 hypothetical 